MQYSQSDSGSDSDDAPEEITVSSAKKGSKQAQKAEREFVAQAAQSKKAKNRATDAKLKAVKGKAKADSAPVPAPVEELEELNGDLSSDPVEEREEQETAKKGTSTTYLDPSLFASAAKFYAPAAYPAEGEGKRGMKKAVREEQRRKAIAANERAEQVREGGKRAVGAITLQHLPSPSNLSSLSSTSTIPSSTKFISARLYSKKRAVAVLDAGNPQPRRGELEGESRKRSKKSGKGMSEESKKLLGMGMDDGAKAVSEEEKRRERKRTLLGQAEGRRKAATHARPLASARAAARPAANFAISTRTR
ncbi:hypothetical protein P7C70_g7684, partial [Phenoliferia sp. Uapishka_3]